MGAGTKNGLHESLDHKQTTKTCGLRAEDISHTNFTYDRLPRFPGPVRSLTVKQMKLVWEVDANDE
jgi:hypothetical protein